jgi:hypothetical protein
MKKTLHIECVGETYSYRTRLTLDDVLEKGRKMVEVDGVPIAYVVDLFSKYLREDRKNGTPENYKHDEAFAKAIFETFLPGYVYAVYRHHGTPKQIDSLFSGSERKWIVGFPAVTEVKTEEGTQTYTFGLDLWKSNTKDLEDGWKEILGKRDFFKENLRGYYEWTGSDIRIPEDTIFRDDRPRTRQIVDPKINPRRLNPLFRTENPYIGDRKDNLDEVNVRVKSKPVNRKKSVSRVASR